MPPWFILLFLLLPATALADTPTTQRVLRVAADPNNLPFSNERREGFENRLAEMIAGDLGAKVEYVWHAQRRGFFREAVKEQKCDLVMGVPKGLDMVLTTRPYYRSRYVFLWRKDRGLKLGSIDDPRLREMKLGVQVIGMDATNTPPAHALARRGVVWNVVGYTLYGDYAEANPPARIVEGVAKGEVDAAVVWGPLAGYFAPKQPVPLEMAAVEPDHDGTLPFAYDICVGVRRGNAKLREEVDEILVKRRADIDQLLAEYGIPVAAGSVEEEPVIDDRAADGK